MKPIIELISDNVSDAGLSTVTLSRAHQKDKKAEKIKSDGDYEGDTTNDDAETQLESNVADDIEAFIQKIE
jgi:hypothetical protein